MDFATLIIIIKQLWWWWRYAQQTTKLESAGCILTSMTCSSSHKVVNSLRREMWSRSVELAPFACQRQSFVQSQTTACQLCRSEQVRGQRHLTVDDIITAPESKRGLRESRCQASRNSDERRNVTRADRGKSRFVTFKPVTIHRSAANKLVYSWTLCHDVSCVEIYPITAWIFDEWNFD